MLLLIGLLTGGFVSAAMTGKVNADPGAALASHLNALLGAFWVVGVGWSLEFLHYGPVGQRRLVWATTLPNVGNWAVTALKAFWKVKGVDAVGDAKNDTIFGLLTLLVVVPSLGAAAAWVYGFKRPVK
ncbi:MAG: hypothetical protein JNK82_35035 [Myxococcaceae bacterium]|nr:hypothetical protein [Myxococcaceae bacterium]